MIAISHGRPRVLDLKEALVAFIDHRRAVVTRRTKFDLRKAVERREIVEGLGVAIDAIDRVIAIIRGSSDPDVARERLMAEPLAGFAAFLERCGGTPAQIEAARGRPYHLGERQAKAILDMRLQRLTGLEREKIEGEYRELNAEIARLEAILADARLLMTVIRDELTELRQLYGDPEGRDAGTGAPGSGGSRRTEIVEDDDEIEPMDLVADESMVVMLTGQGYIKRLPTEDYRVQARGGKGVKGGGGRGDDDFVSAVLEAKAHAWLLLFTDTGRVFRKRVFELPLARRDGPGKALVNFLELRDDERVLEMVPYHEDEIEDENYIVTVTAKGYIKRTQLSEFANMRKTGLIAVSIDEDDRLIGVRFTDGKQHIMLSSADGMVIRFDEAEVRAMGRNARGVRGMGLREQDRVVAMSCLSAQDDEALQVLTICANGYGKRTPASEYRPQSRAGLGLITIKVNERNGEVVENLLVHPDDHIIVITSDGKVIRTPVDGISVLGRNTQGVRIIRMGKGERVVAAARMLDDGDKRDDDGGVVARGEEISTEHVEASEDEDEDEAGDGPEAGEVEADDEPEADDE
jgi:DNA gyrase subunit A